MTPFVVVGLLLRFVHIGSAIVLLGAALFGVREEKHRRWVLAAALTIVLSGLYNLFAKSNVPSGYHMIFGIKMLFALHVLAVSFLLHRANTTEEKRRRLEAGLRWTGVVILLLSAYLRHLSNWMIV